jgi:WD40 repeat protein
VGIGRQIEVWHTPSTPDSNVDGELEFAPFVRHRVHAGHYDTIQSIRWSSDSRFFLSAAKDLTTRIWSLEAEEGFVPTTLAGHREAVAGAWFTKDQETVNISIPTVYFKPNEKDRYTLSAVMELCFNGSTENGLLVMHMMKMQETAEIMRNYNGE